MANGAPARERLVPPQFGRVCLRRAIALVTAALATVAVGLGIGLVLRPPTVQGHIIDVEARDIGHAATITIRDVYGVSHVFEVDVAVAMTPGHLREHMMYGEPVTATLARTSGIPGRAVVIRIVDGLQ